MLKGIAYYLAKFTLIESSKLLDREAYETIDTTQPDLKPLLSSLLH